MTLGARIVLPPPPLPCVSFCGTMQIVSQVSFLSSLYTVSEDQTKGFTTACGHITGVCGICEQRQGFPALSCFKADRGFFFILSVYLWTELISKEMSGKVIKKHGGF